MISTSFLRVASNALEELPPFDLNRPKPIFGYKGIFGILGEFLKHQPWWLWRGRIF
jgi:hypothetical protein